MQRLPQVGVLVPTTARHYVDYMQAHLDVNDHINKGENDGEDLSAFKDETIASRLRAKIHDSTITIVLISKNMKDRYLSEEDQWIPWEISYSLKEHARDGRTSGTNAIIAVIIPDENGSYEHFVRENTCQGCDSRTLMTDSLFEILRRNMFNRRAPRLLDCGYHPAESKPHIGDDHSYIHSVKWEDFIGNVNWHLEIADSLNENVHEFDLVKAVRY